MATEVEEQIRGGYLQGERQKEKREMKRISLEKNEKCREIGWVKGVSNQRKEMKESEGWRKLVTVL